MELHEKLKGLREDRDLKLKDVAEILNTSTQYYQKYEKGKHPIPVTHLRTLCLFYQVSADDLLDLPDGLHKRGSKRK
jgi:transcriptional regulator with XRE-family HTH domain